MSLKELRAEFELRFQERLGLLCEDRYPTKEQEAIAHVEAYKAIIELNKQSRKQQDIL